MIIVFTKTLYKVGFYTDFDKLLTELDMAGGRGLGAGVRERMVHNQDVIKAFSDIRGPNVDVYSYIAPC